MLGNKFVFTGASDSLRSEVAVNTAGILAEAGQDVIIVECDPDGVCPSDILHVDDIPMTADRAITEKLDIKASVTGVDLPRSYEGSLNIICASTSVPSMGEELESLLSDHGTLIVDIGPYDYGDPDILDSAHATVCVTSSRSEDVKQARSAANLSLGTTNAVDELVVAQPNEDCPPANESLAPFDQEPTEVIPPTSNPDAAIAYAEFVNELLFHGEATVNLGTTIDTASPPDLLSTWDGVQEPMTDGKGEVGEADGEEEGSGLLDKLPF